MADQKEETEAATDNAAASRKMKMLSVGGLFGALAAGAIAAMVAVPSVKIQPRFKGPFSVPLDEEQFNCNIVERSHYLQMKPEVIFQAFDENYLATRLLDPLYHPEMKNAVFRVASNKSMDDLFGEVNQDGFMEELADTLGPILFPVHIGEGALPWDIDEASGLRPGLSADKTNFRGNFHYHSLHVDGPQGTLQIDAGPLSSFKPLDPDVRVIDVDGSTLFVDVSGLVEGFVGEVTIGVKGRILLERPS